jgi:hypothetical protein
MLEVRVADDFEQANCRIPDGRQKTTHIGGSPPRTMAMWVLIELEEERLSNPKFTQPGE